MKGKVADWMEGFMATGAIDKMVWKMFGDHLDKIFINVDDARIVRQTVLNHQFNLQNQSTQEASLRHGFDKLEQCL